MIGIHDLGRAELEDSLVQRFDAEVGFQRVGDPPGQHLPGLPVHDGNQIEEAAPHRPVGDVGAPDLIGPFHAQSTQQIGLGLVPLRGFAGVGLLVDRHQAHKPHRSPDTLAVHNMALVPQVPRHLLDAVERCFEELLVDHNHEVEVHGRLAHQFLVARSTAGGIVPRPTGSGGSCRSSFASLAGFGLELSEQKKNRWP